MTLREIDEHPLTLFLAGALTGLLILLALLYELERHV